LPIPPTLHLTSLVRTSPALTLVVRRENIPVRCDPRPTLSRTPAPPPCGFLT
jgi:hypothetical protein